MNGSCTQACSRTLPGSTDIHSSVLVGPPDMRAFYLNSIFCPKSDAPDKDDIEKYLYKRTNKKLAF